MFGSCHTSFFQRQGSFSNLSDIIRNEIIYVIRVATWNNYYGVPSHRFILKSQIEEIDFINGPQTQKIG